MFNNPKVKTTFGNLLPEAKTKVIVLRGDPLDDKQLNLALKGIGDQSWKALVQLTEQLRFEHLDSATGWAPQNNALGIARDIGAYEALSELLNAVDRERIT